MLAYHSTKHPDSAMQKGRVRVVVAGKEMPKKALRKPVAGTARSEANEVFDRICDPKNDHLFSVDAALAAFAHIA